MAEQYPTFLAGQRLTASLLTSSQPMTARKTSDTSRASTTTTTADPELTFELVANGVYIWDGWLKYTGIAAGDINIDFTIPTGALGEYTAFGAGRGVISATGTPGVLQANTADTNGYMIRTESNDISQARSFGAIAGTDFSLLMSGIVRVSTTAGTFALEWAQAVSDATATVVYTDSWMRLQRIA